MKLGEYYKALHKDPKNEELRMEYFRSCFNAIQKVNGDFEKLVALAEREDINVDLIRGHAKTYAIKILHMSQEMYYEMYTYPIYLNRKALREIPCTPVNNLFLNLMDENEPDHIIRLIENAIPTLNPYYVQNMRRLKYRVSDFICTYFSMKQEYLLDSLNKKIDIYLNYSKENKKNAVMIEEQKMLQELQEKEQILYKNRKKILFDFIQIRTISRKDYCNMKGLLLADFDSIITLAQKYDLELYQVYCEVIQKQNAKRYAVLMAIIDKMIYQMECGIECENGTIRTFDIIDYYQSLNLSFSELIRICQSSGIDRKKLDIIKVFIAKNKSKTKSDPKAISRIRRDYQEVDCQKDSQGNLLPGTGRVLEMSEKKQIIQFLTLERIPVNQGTYQIALRRYLNGSLLFKNPEHGYVKKRKMI